MKTQLIFDPDGNLIIEYKFGWKTDTTFVSKLRHKMREEIVDNKVEKQLKVEL